MLEFIPVEILYQIFLQLNPKDIVSISSINVEFNMFIKGYEYLWKSLCEKYNVGTMKEKETSWREWFKSFHLWQWDLAQVSEHLNISSNRLICSRESFGSNPSAKANWPFSSIKSVFEVTVISPGNWLSIGLSTTNFSVHSGYYLGSAIYKNVFECTYYSDKFMSDVLYMGTKVKDCSSVQTGDTITIFTEPYTIHFFKNNTLLCSVNLTDRQLADFVGKDSNISSPVTMYSLQLVPTVSIGSGGKLTISRTYRKSDLLNIIAADAPAESSNPKRIKII